MARDAVFWPDCGWTGTDDHLEVSEGVHTCSVCDRTIEFVD